MPNPKALLAEFIGTAFLLAVVVGSGIMGESLAQGNNAIALLGNTIATGAILFVMISIFAPLSGAHFNPAVTLAFTLRGELSKKHAMYYVCIQISGALLGVVIAHLMFELPALMISTNARSGLPQGFAEFIATLGLLLTIFGCIKVKPQQVAAAVGLYITAGYWFTASTSFANPAVTLARSFTDTFSGIHYTNAPGFIAAQFFAAIVAVPIARYLWGQLSFSSPDDNG